VLVEDIRGTLRTLGGLGWGGASQEFLQRISTTTVASWLHESFTVALHAVLGTGLVLSQNLIYMEISKMSVHNSLWLLLAGML
jgi:hypothetical protein